MAKIHFRPYNPNQIVLFPQRMDENIPSDDPVRILNAMVDNLDLSSFHKLYKELGRSPYHPRMMLKAVLYAYLNNIYSCRKIEKSLTRDIHFIWLAGNERPDHQTINRFRNRVKAEINKIFTQVVLVLAAKGFISLDVEYVDGTKIESKTDPDATFMRMKEDHMKNGQTKPGYNLQIGTENQFLVNFALYPNPTDTLTMIPFETSFMERYGHFPSEEIADSGYGSEENYRFMEENGIKAFVKYNFFHKEQRPRYVADPFRQESFYYNREEDYYVCPMGQHMKRIGVRHSKTESGYVSESVRYRAVRCEGCPLRCMCFRSKAQRRTIEVNHRLTEYRKKARERLTSEKGIRHRGQRCIEPEAVFGQIKYDMAYKRFRHFGKDKITMDFAFFAIAFNIKKMCAKIKNEKMKTKDCANIRVA